MKFELRQATSGDVGVVLDAGEGNARDGYPEESEEEQTDGRHAGEVSI